MKYKLLIIISLAALIVACNNKTKGDETIKYLKTYSMLPSFNAKLAKVKSSNRSSNGKWGYVDVYGNEIVPTEYDFASEFVNGVARIGKKINDYIDEFSLINENGEIITSETYGYIGSPSDGYSYVLDYRPSNINGIQINIVRLGFIDLNGNMIIPFSKGLYYQDDDLFGGSYFHHAPLLYGFKDGLAIVANQQMKYGCVNLNGDFVIAPKYDKMEAFEHGYSNVCINEKWGIIDMTGTVIVPLIYENIAHGKDFICAKMNEKYGLLHQNKPVTDFVYDIMYQMYYFDNNYRLCTDNHLIRAKRNNKWGFIDPEGNEITPFKYDELPFDDKNNFNEDGLYAVKFQGFYGAVNKDGIEIIPPKYNKIEPLGEGCFDADNNIYNKNGSCLISNNAGLSGFHKFSEGLCSATDKDDRCIFINPQGKIVMILNKDITTTWNFQDGLCAVRNNKSKYGFINTDGEQVIPFKFEDIFGGGFKNNVCVVKKDFYSNAYIIDKKGNPVNN